MCYEWKYDNRWNGWLSVKAEFDPLPLEPGSHEEYITEHFWGYSSMGRGKTGEYQVEHPRWDIYSVWDFSVFCRFGDLYGPAFAGLRDQEPETVFLAEGSPIKVYGKKNI